jgi:hypothetical protein
MASLFSLSILSNNNTMPLLCQQLFSFFALQNKPMPKVPANTVIPQNLNTSCEGIWIWLFLDAFDHAYICS